MNVDHAEKEITTGPHIVDFKQPVEYFHPPWY